MKYLIKFSYKDTPYKAEIESRNIDAAKNSLMVKASHQFGNLNYLKIISVEPLTENKKNENLKKV